MMERCLWRNEDTHVDVGENESNGLPPNSSGMRSLRNMFWCDYFLHLTLHLFIFKYFMKKLYLWLHLSIYSIIHRYYCAASFKASHGVDAASKAGNLRNAVRIYNVLARQFGPNTHVKEEYFLSRQQAKKKAKVKIQHEVNTTVGCLFRYQYIDWCRITMGWFPNTFTFSTTVLHQSKAISIPQFPTTGSRTESFRCNIITENNKNAIRVVQNKIVKKTNDM